MNRKLILLILALSITLIVVRTQITNFDNFRNINDGSQYIAIAEGHLEKATLLARRRILYPLLINKLIRFLGVDFSFLALGIISLFFILVIILTIVRLCVKQHYFIYTVLFFIPSIFILFSELYSPVIFFVFLSSLYWLCLMLRRYLLGILISPFLLLTHDFGIVIIVSFILALAVEILKNRSKFSNYFYLFSSFVLMSLSFIFIENVTKNVVNYNRAPFLIYFFGRITMFFISNFLGFRLWLGTYVNLPLLYNHAPLIIFDAPHWISKISIVKQIGVYEWDLRSIVTTWLLILSSFGTGPTMLIFFLKKRGFRIFKNTLSLNTMMFSGCSSFILAPLVGPSAHYNLRYYYTNAWVLFFLILPLFLEKIFLVEKTIFFKILVCYSLSAWLFFLFSRLGIYLSLSLEIIFHVYAWHLLSLAYKNSSIKLAENDLNLRS